MELYIQFSQEEKAALIDKIVDKMNPILLMDNIERNISSKVLNSCNDIFANMNNEYDQLKSLFLNKVHTVGNIRAIFHEIRTERRLDAEECAIEFFKAEGFKIIGRCSDPKTLWNCPVPESLNRILTEPIKGRPDLIGLSGESYIFIEVKTNGDGLRCEQMEWLNSHPSVNVIIFYLKQNVIKEIKKGLNLSDVPDGVSDRAIK